MKWLLPVLLASCAAPELGEAVPVAVRTVYGSPYCAMSGSVQVIERIRQASELDAAWNRHTASQLTPPPPPVVDFTRRHLVLVALGQRATAGYGLELASTRGELRDRQLSIEISRQQPAADSMTAQVLTSPCLLIEIDAAANRVDAVVVRDPAVGSVAR